MRRSFTAMFALTAALAIPATASAALPGGNLLTNPGAEVGPVGDLTDFSVSEGYAAIPGWTDFDAPRRMRALDEAQDDDGNADFIHVSERADALGCRLFAGPGNPSDAEYAPADDGLSLYGVYQNISLAGADASTKLRFGAVLQRYSEFGHENDDGSAVTLRFLDANFAVVGAPIRLGDDGVQAPVPPVKVVVTPVDMANISIPAGAAYASIGVFSEPTGLNQAHPSPADGTVDNVYLTADNTVPAPPAAGCQAPTAATTGATEITQTSARLNGTVDTHGEIGSWTLRISTDPALLGQGIADGVDVNGALAITGVADGLNPGTTYYYRVDATTYQSGPSSAYGNVLTPMQSFTTAAAPTGGGGGVVTPPVVIPPAADPFAKPLTVTLESFKQTRSKVLVSGFEFKMKTNHPGDFKAQVYVRDVKNKAKKYPCGGSPFKEHFSGPYDIVGRSYQASGMVATSKCSAQLRAKSFKKRVGRRKKKVKVSSNTMLVVWSFVDTRGKKTSGTFSYVVK